MLVFSGVPFGSYLHAMGPDGTDLTSFAIPSGCSPRGFVSSGHVLLCDEVSWGDDLGRYAMERQGHVWRRVPLPAELEVPRWLNVSQEPWDDRVQWAPAGDRIAFIPSNIADYWFSPGGKVMVADADGSNQHRVAEDAEVPRWSPDGKRLAFARCEIEGKSWPERTATCSLWIVPADGIGSEKLLVDDADSPPVWSPDGRFVAFIRHSDPCRTYCRARIFVIGVEDHEPRAVGPDLVELAEYYPAPWPGLAWLPDAASNVAAGDDEVRGDQLELQRCVDIWNRARMRAWPTGAVSVSFVADRCQVTVSDYGAVCTQSAEMPFRFWCPSHGAGVHRLPPESLVWNAHGDEDGRISLFDEPKGPRLALPKAPQHPLLDGWVIPYGKDGEPLPDLKLTKVAGTCEVGAMPGYPLAYPGRYSVRCFWGESEGSENCFVPRATVAAGDTVFCPDAWWERRYDPMSFFAVEVTDVY